MREEIAAGLSQIAILAGGAATRLRPITEAVPKSMLPVAGRPFILHQLELLKRNNISRVLICAGYLRGQILECVKDGSAHGVSVRFSFDGDELLGTGGALLKALPLLEDSFFVMYGDSYLDIDFKPVMDFFLSSRKKGLMTLFKNEGRFGRSNVAYIDGKIVRYDKEGLSSEMKYIDYGLMVFKKEVLEGFGSRRPFDLTELCKRLIKEEHMAGFEVKERFYEIGSPGGLKETDEYISGRISKPGRENGGTGWKRINT